MGSTHRISGTRVVAVVALVVLGSLAACASTNSATTHSASKAAAPVAGCPVAASTTAQDALAHDACNALGNLTQSAQAAQSVQTVYDAGADSVTVTITVGGAVPLTDQQISVAQELTKAISLREQQAMWGSGVMLKEAKVMVFGPTQDEYANIIAQPYGSSVLDTATAAHFDWANLSADSAWIRYDSVYLRPTFDVVDDVPVAP